MVTIHPSSNFAQVGTPSSASLRRPVEEEVSLWCLEASFIFHRLKYSQLELEIKICFTVL